jgi:hypothetical protein
VKQPVHSRNSRDVQSSQADLPASGPPSSAVDLSSVQKRVLDCLGSSGKALTLRQLETAVSCPAGELTAAVEDLVQRRLVLRLNTLIPSYANGYPGVRVYGE